MKVPSLLLTSTAIILCVANSVSCMTAYDAQGRPIQTVDPAVAIAGVAAAGLVGYAAGNNRHHHHGGYYGGGGYYRSRGYSHY